MKHLKVLALTSLLPLSLFADTTYDWVGASGGVWSLNTNWNPSGPPNSSTSIAVFGTIGAPQTVTVDAAFGVEQVTISSSTNGYTFSPSGGGAITFESATPSQQLLVSSGTHTWNVNILITAPITTFTIENNSPSNPFTIGGNINTVLVAPTTCVLAGSGGGIVLGGTGNLFTNFQASTPLTISAATNLSVTNTFTLASTLEYTGATNSLALGSFVLGGNSVISVDNLATTLTIPNGITDGGSGYSLTKNGLGILALTSNGNTYSGGTIINDGILSITSTVGTGPIAFNNGGVLQIDGAGITIGSNVQFNAGGGVIDTTNQGLIISAQLVGANSFTKAGISNLSLTYASPSALFTGPIVISAGSFSIAQAQSMGTPSSITLENGVTFEVTSDSVIPAPFSLGVGGGGFFNANGNILTLSGQITGTSLTQGASGTIILTNPNNNYSGGTNISSGTLSATNGGALGAGPINISNGSTLQAGGDINFGANVQFNNPGGGIIDTNGNDIIFGAQMAGVGSFTKINNGNLNLIYPNPSALFTGPIVISGGSLSIAQAQSMGTPSGITLENSATFEITSDSVIPAPITLGVGGGGLFNAGGNTLTLSGQITGTSLTQVGSGTVALTNPANNYSGGTMISSGTLSATSGDALGGGPIDMNNGGTLQAGGTINFGANVEFDNPGGGIIDTNGNNITFEAQIAGVGALTKINSGTLNLNYPNPSALFTGPIVISGGTLSIAQVQSMGTPSTISLTSGGILQVASDCTIPAPFFLGTGGGGIDTDGNTITLGTQLNGAGTFSKINSGTLNLTYPNPSALFTGPLVVSGGTLSIAQVQSMGTPSSITLENGATFEVLPTSLISTPFILGTGGGVLNTNGNTLTLSGQITGTNLTQATPGTIILTNSTNNYSGTTISNGVVQGNASSLQGNIATSGSGIAIFSSNSNGTYAGLMTGTGTVRKQGTGTLTIAQNMTQNATFIDAGTLSSDQSMTSDVTIAAGATLVGSPQITGNVINNGTISPGHSIGAVAITGNYTQNGALIIELTPSAIDTITVSGTTTINPSASIIIEPNPSGDYPASLTQVILSSVGAITGQFQPSNVTITLPTFIGSLNYTTLAGLNVIEIVFSKIALALPFLSFNAAAVARDLDILDLTASGDLAYVISLLRLLPLSELNGALLQMQSSFYNAIDDANLQNNLGTTRVVMHHLFDYANKLCQNNDDPRKNNVWGNFYGQRGHQRGEGEFSSYRPHDYGFLIGLDRLFSPGLSAGFAVGYSYSTLHWKDLAAKAHMNTAYASLYGQYLFKHFFTNLCFMGNLTQNIAKRRIVFPGLDRTAHRTNLAGGMDTHVDVGAIFDIATVRIRPFLSGDYLFEAQQSYKEAGANSIDLDVSEKIPQLVVGEAGINFSRCFQRRAIQLIPTAKAGWMIQRMYGERFTKASFIHTSPTFTVRGFVPKRHLWTFGGQVEVTPNGSLCSFSAMYDGEVGSGWFNQRAILNFDCAF